MKKGITVRLDDEVLDKLKIYCINNKTTIQSLLEKYIKIIISEKNPK